MHHQRQRRLAAAWRLDGPRVVAVAALFHIQWANRAHSAIIQLMRRALAQHLIVTSLSDENDRGAPVREEIWLAVAREFSDIPDLSTITLITVRLMIAAVLGGILGYERERKKRSAGIRTHMLVAVGAALYVIGPLQSGMPIEDMSRVLQGVVQGIGFLGAGAIMIRAKRHEVEGLTTAANIWATAAIGVIAGLGLEATAILSTAIVLIILAAVPLVMQKDPGNNHDSIRKE